LLLYSCSFYFIYIFFRFPFFCFFHSLYIYRKYSCWSTTNFELQKKLFEAPGFVKPINRMSVLLALLSQFGTPGGLDRSASKCFFILTGVKSLIGVWLAIIFFIDVKEKLWTYIQNQSLLPSHFTSSVNYAVTCKLYAKYVSRHNSLVIR
jgi:hypothetical protein